MIDPEIATDHSLGGPVIAGDPAPNLGNAAPFQQAMRAAKKETRRVSGTTPWLKSTVILTVIEAVAFTWWAFSTQYNTINAIAYTAHSSNYQLLIKVAIGAVILFVYLLLSYWLIKNLRWVAFVFFGLLWAYIGFHLAEYFGGNYSWKLGSAAVLALLVSIKST